MHSHTRMNVSFNIITFKTLFSVSSWCLPLGQCQQSLAAWKIWVCPRLHFQKALIPLPCYNMAFCQDSPRNSHHVTPVGQGVPCLATHNFMKSNFFFPFEIPFRILLQYLSTFLFSIKYYVSVYIEVLLFVL